jgi:hypothetical protein
MMLSEFKVLYEVLWMLQVPTESGVFYQDEQGLFQVKRSVSLPSTIPVRAVSLLSTLN